ncbi:MAG TPA: 5-oxoprolinase subunit PxpB [Candidatus Eisenbacteria bacterium]|nr:5-oxoprolinase subunit PxpB [Candidatus Eisenbacteria bacterium]
MRRIVPAGDRALLIVFGDTMTPETLADLLTFEAALRRVKPHGLIGTVPAYASLLCTYDPDVISGPALERQLRALAAPQRRRLPQSVHEVPVRYEGPDLARVAQHAGLSVADVVSTHAATEYLVYAIGFAPGFTYCGILPEVLATPRLPSPRTRVEPGSVGIAGRQTGMYAVASPGGWNIIGRTDTVLFDPRRRPPARFRPGDRLRFVPA